MFNQDKGKVLYPISGETGVITILELTAIIKSLHPNTLTSLNITKIYQLSISMQRAITG